VTGSKVLVLGNDGRETLQRMIKGISRTKTELEGSAGTLVASYQTVKDVALIVL